MHGLRLGLDLDRGERFVELRLLRPDPGRREPLRGPQLGHEPGQIVQRHRLDPLHDLIERQQRGTGQDLRAEPVHPRAGRLEREYDAALQVLLGAAQLVLTRRALAYAMELARDYLHRLAEVVGPRAPVQADLARVLTGAGEP